MAANTFLKPATKEKAILKLSTIEIKMGYPDKVDPIFDQFVVNRKDSLYKTMSNLYKVILFPCL